MVSKFEDTLLRGGVWKRRLRNSLFDQIENASLRSLRRTSHSLHDLVDQSCAARLFIRLSVHTTTVNKPHAVDLKRLAPFCQNLTLRVGDLAVRPASGKLLTSKKFISASFVGQLSSVGPEQTLRSPHLPRPVVAPNSPPPEQPLTITLAHSSEDCQALWSSVLSSFKNITSITFKVYGNPGWRGRTSTEEMLVTLRIALEKAAPANLRTFTLAPIQAMGLVHLRWSGFGAFHSTPSPSCQLWQNLSTLDIRMRNPSVHYRLSDSQQLMFTAILHEYLRSFAPTLQSLCFVWLDGNGPSPLTLDLQPGMSGHRAIQWPQLEHVWLGNILLPYRTIRYSPQRAQRLQSLNMLRSTEHDSLPAMDKDEAWVSIPLGIRTSEDADKDDAASSIYSRSRSSGRISVDEFGGTSRVVPFYLDLGERFE